MVDGFLLFEEYTTKWTQKNLKISKEEGNPTHFLV